MNVHTLVSPQNVSFLIEQARKTPTGIFVEVGVYKGGTAYYLNQLAKERGNELWLFDTFEGMPESTPGIDSHLVGDFADCSYEVVKKLIPEARIFAGVFPKTFFDFTFKYGMNPIAFAHIDCDQYESIKNCIRYLIPFLVTDGIMYFDDYGCLEGTTKAIDKFCPDRIILENGKAMYVKI